MRLLIFFIFSMSTQAAVALPFSEVSVNQPVCLAANYSPDYMAAHPFQKTSAVWMMLYKDRDPKDPTLYMNLQVTMRGEIFRAGMLCDHRANGSLHCAIECDGGQAELWPNSEAPGNSYFVNKGIYVSGACDHVDKPVLMEPTSGGDDVFDLAVIPCH